jgi:hypothetical protein
MPTKDNSVYTQYILTESVEEVICLFYFCIFYFKYPAKVNVCVKYSIINFKLFGNKS